MGDIYFQSPLKQEKTVDVAMGEIGLRSLSLFFHGQGRNPTLSCQDGLGSFSFSLLGKASKKKTVFFLEISPKCGGWGVLFPKKVQTPQNLPKSPPPA